MKFILQKYIQEVLKLISTSNFLDPKTFFLLLSWLWSITSILSTEIIDQALKSSTHLGCKTSLPLFKMLFLTDAADSHVDRPHVI